jgi:hypothetical protein
MIKQGKRTEERPEEDREGQLLVAEERQRYAQRGTERSSTMSLLRVCSYLLIGSKRRAEFCCLEINTDIQLLILSLSLRERNICRRNVSETLRLQQTKGKIREVI